MQDFIQPGKLYRHFKGNTYYVHFLGTDTETSRPIVVYQQIELIGDTIRLVEDKIWCRPLESFRSDSIWHNEEIPRFVALEGIKGITVTEPALPCSFGSLLERIKEYYFERGLK